MTLAPELANGRLALRAAGSVFPASAGHPQPTAAQLAAHPTPVHSP